MPGAAAFVMCWCALLLGVAAGNDVHAAAPAYDLVIRHGRIIDGTGSPWVRADVAIKDGRFVRIGRVEAKGAREIDATGKYVTPGWIDVMDQSGRTLMSSGLAENKLRQGITTAIAGEAGTPVPAEKIAEFFAQLERQGISLNFGTYYGATQARVEVIGDGAAPPDRAQLAAMRARVRTAMEAGAFGISTALIYPPATFQSTDELVELAKVVADYGGYYATHMRDESRRLIPAIEEAIAIGERSGAKVEIFHLKAAYAPGWGTLMQQAGKVISAARERGIDVAADMYPYTAGGTGLDVTVPSWVFAEGPQKALERLRDPAVRVRLKKEIVAPDEGWSNMIEAAGGWGGIVLANSHSPKWQRYHFKSIADIARQIGRDPADIAWDIILDAAPNRAVAYFHMMDEQDVATALRFPWTSIGSDSSAALKPGEVDGLGLPHPRSYGTFPRVIAEYVRGRNVISLPEAIRKMTGWPAARYGLSDRGVIREQLRADVVVFDYDTIADTATWEHGTTFPVGIDTVIVNGTLVVDGGAHTGAKPGMILRGPGFEPLRHASDAARLSTFFEEIFERDLRRSPILQTSLGRKDDYDKLDDLSEAHEDETVALARRDLQRLRSEFDPQKLDEMSRQSYRIFELLTQQTIEADRWRHHDYPVTQLSGWPAQLPSFLIASHLIADVRDAESYVARLRQSRRLIGQVIDAMERRANQGIIPPKFVFPKAIANAANVISGAPFDSSGADSVLLADFRRKVELLDAAAAQKARLMQSARAALVESVGPAYREMAAALTRLERRATGDAGVWKLPQGEEYYQFQLRRNTTTNLSAAEIHELGLKEVARIKNEMRGVIAATGFKGSLEEFFRLVNTEARFYYPQTQAGRQQYVAAATAHISEMNARLDQAFRTRPDAKVEVREIEAFRASGAGTASYQPPSLDGTRPGYFYVNTHDMRQMPKHQLEALVYHEAIPGHHLQLTLAQQLQGLPMFRRLADFTAYTEGWGLYAERLGKDMGFYRDPESDFGRLAFELRRATRLVLDTGIHSRKWTREQAIAFFAENTPNPPGDSIREVERYFVAPGQATAYTIGMLKILALREKARTTLGDDFDIRDFHEVVLGSGAVPLSMLEQNVAAWLARRTRRPE